MKSVMSSLALRQQFAQFFADTEPPEGAVWPARGFFRRRELVMTPILI
jgi:hypothetical protein